MFLLLIIGGISLLFYLFLAGGTLLGIRQIGQLQDVIAPASVEQDWPVVSIIVPALNEAATIKPALASILALDYPFLEIIAVNDRSTDETGAILEEMAHNAPRLKVHHLAALPAGWLGKNHALWFGAARAKGDLLLFTDADVVMGGNSLRQAVGYLQMNNLDHLAIFFDTLVPGGLLNMLIIDFACAFLAVMKPWKARRPGTRHHIGIGAFNLVRSKTYQRCGTHQALAMHPVDDVELGRLIKTTGGRQDCLLGHHAISVKWYGSVAALVHGLEKNIFPFCQYSIFRVMAFSTLIIIFRIWPLLAILFCQGPVAALNLFLVTIQLGVAIAAASRSGLLVRHVIWFPLSPFIGLYILWNSTTKTLYRGGIIWRGTFYSLAELKKKGRNAAGKATNLYN